MGQDAVRVPGFVEGVGHCLPDPIRNLQQLDVAIGLALTAVALLSLGLLSETAAATPAGETVTPSVEGTLRRTLVQARDDVTFALRWIAGPVIWLMSTFSLAYLAWIVTNYLQSVAQSRAVMDLFNPFAANARARYWEGALTIELTSVTDKTSPPNCGEEGLCELTHQMEDSMESILALFGSVDDCWQNDEPQWRPTLVTTPNPAT